MRFTLSRLPESPALRSNGWISRTHAAGPPSGCCGLSLLIVVMANTALIVAAPGHDPRPAADELGSQWVIDGYTVPYAALMAAVRRHR